MIDSCAPDPEWAGKVFDKNDTILRRMQTNKNQLQQAVESVRQDVEKSKPIMLLQWDDISQSLKFAIDVMKYVSITYAA